MDNKLTDTEIIKALDICSKSTNGCSHSNYTCEDCYLNGQPMCSSVLLQDTIDLINRQKAEIIRLSSLLKKKGRELTRKRKRCDELVEEKIRLQKEIKTVIECKFESVSQSAKAEAYQECIEKFKSIFGEWIYDYKLDNLLKELAGDSNAKEKK